MKLVIDENIKKADAILFECFRFLNLIRHVNPTNLPEEKEAFFSHKKRNPTFTYKPPRRNVNDLRNTLHALDIPNHDLGKIYEKIRRQLLKQCTIIEHIGINDSIVKELTSDIYGWPNEVLVRSAKKVLREVPEVDITYNIPPEVIMGSVQMMFDEIGLDDWEVKPSKKWISAARHTRKVTICKDRFFSELDIKRLAVHEVGVHAIRYTNGDHQPLKIFHFGFPESLSTEEGLAVYFEVATGNMTPMYFRNYAGRVLAIDCLRRNLDFRDCFSELQHYGFNDEDSWNLAVRVYRGGGFVKDHVDLQGY